VFKEINVDPVPFNVPSYPTILLPADLGAIFKIRPDTVFTDTAGTIPANYGQGVARVNSLNNPAAWMQQTVEAECPIFGRMPKNGRRNRLIYSELFTDAAWAKTNMNVSETTDSTDPFGQTNATYIAPTNVSGEHFIAASSGLSIPAGTHNLAFYVKPDTMSRVYLRCTAGGTTRLLIVDSSFGNITSNTGFTNPLVQTLTGGWLRISVTVTISSPATANQMMQIGVASLQNLTFTGDGQPEHDSPYLSAR
jgi:hypothetical protein